MDANLTLRLGTRVMTANVDIYRYCSTALRVLNGRAA